MSARHIAAMIGAAALAGGAAGVAHAADPLVKPVDFTVRPDNAASPTGGPKSFKADVRHGRFGVTLDLQQPDTRPGNWNDVQAGAYFRITPSLRVGGAVALGGEQMQALPNKLAPDAGQPRVRLETQFKF
ncbi:MAG TPA: hypothetical protein VHV27_02835 [Phenylobacterium sp.]|jgi:hypothetical protein|nr:hypothetical protein [Phenylobacterium sp.]